MREARRQLAYTSLQVASIAYTLGYADPAHFSRAFSRVEGLSPRAFRERLVAHGRPWRAAPVPRRPAPAWMCCGALRYAWRHEHIDEL